MHPSIILAIVAAGLAALGAGFAVVSHLLRRVVEPHWARTRGRWLPWRPVGMQRIAYLVDGVVYEARDVTTRRLPRWGEDDVLYDPEHPERSVVDAGPGPGGGTFLAAVACWCAAGICVLVAIVLPFLIARVESLAS